MPVATGTPAHRRHDISDRVWEILGPLSSAARARWAGQLRATSVSATRCSGFCPRAGPATGLRGLEEHPPPLLPLARPGSLGLAAEVLIEELDLEWLMRDASYIKARPHRAGARGGSQAIARTKGG